MTYLVENEQAALIIPARLLSRLHPHFREVMQLLASQAADEARHVEVFTRRGLLTCGTSCTTGASRSTAPPPTCGDGLLVYDAGQAPLPGIR